MVRRWLLSVAVETGIIYCPANQEITVTNQWTHIYRGADKSLARPGRKQANISVRMAWISFGALSCRKKKNLMTARVSMLLKSRASLTCFRDCLLPGRAKDLSAVRYYLLISHLIVEQLLVSACIWSSGK
jgi:hypothetical protein